MKIKNSMSTKEVIAGILQMPPLQESGYLNVDPRRTLLCLQREYGIFDSKDIKETDHPIEYIGTKKLLSCIFAYVQNEHGEYFFTHADKGMINILSGIEKYKHTSTNLNVTLIGGNLIVEGNSSGIVEKIVKELLELSQKFNITIVGQKILEHNLPRQDDREITAYDKLIEKSMVLFLYLYGKPMNRAFLRENFFFSNFSKESSVPFTSLMLVFVLSYICGKMPAQTLKMIDARCPEIKNNHPHAQQNFYRHLGNLIRPTGLKALEVAKITGLDFKSASLRNLVIKLETGEIFRIPEYTPTYLENLREALMMEEGGHTFHFYNQGHYQPPQLSANFVKRYREASELIKESKYFKDSAEPDEMSDAILSIYYDKYNPPKTLGPTLQEHHASILSDNLFVIFAETRKFISSEGVKLIAEFATEHTFS